MASALLHNSRTIPIVKTICDWYDKADSTGDNFDKFTSHVNGIESQYNHVEELKSKVENLKEKLDYAREEFMTEDEKLDFMVNEAEQDFLN